MRLPAEAPPGMHPPTPSPSRRRSRGAISKRRLRRRGVTGDEERGAGERALMRAVLEDAIRCLAGQVGRSLDRAFLAAKARAWIERRDPSWPFSFDNICQELDLDPDVVRARLLAPANGQPRMKNGQRCSRVG